MCVFVFLWCFKPNFKMGLYSVLFSLACLLKTVVILIAVVVVILNKEHEKELVFYVFTSALIAGIMLYFERKLLWTCRNL